MFSQGDDQQHHHNQSQFLKSNECVILAEIYLFHCLQYYSFN